MLADNVPPPQECDSYRPRLGVFTGAVLAEIGGGVDGTAAKVAMSYGASSALCSCVHQCPDGACVSEIANSGPRISSKQSEQSFSRLAMRVSP